MLLIPVLMDLKITDVIVALFIASGVNLTASAQESYAEKLGYPKNAKVLILHVDDVGMSWESNQGAIQAIEKGVANSLSVMMPCPWVPGIVHHLAKNPTLDAG